MSESLCKIISSLNSNEVRDALESLGYTYDIAPLKYFNNILRNKYTLDYNVKIFNASKEQINAICLAIINKVFKDEYIRLLIKNNICMLSYSYNKVVVNDKDVVDIESILGKYLGRAKYCYILHEDNLKLIIDIPPRTDVSRWKPVLKERIPSIILDLMNNGVTVNTIETVFSYEDKELDDVSNVLLELGFRIEKEPIKKEEPKEIKDVPVNLKPFKETNNIALDRALLDLEKAFNDYISLKTDSIVCIADDLTKSYIHLKTEEIEEIKETSQKEYNDFISKLESINEYDTKISLINTQIEKYYELIPF